jgi:hypothetical protein
MTNLEGRCIDFIMCSKGEIGSQDVLKFVEGILSSRDAEWVKVVEGILGDVNICVDCGQIYAQDKAEALAWHCPICGEELVCITDFNDDQFTNLKAEAIQTMLKEEK